MLCEGIIVDFKGPCHCGLILVGNIGKNCNYNFLSLSTPMTNLITFEQTLGFMGLNVVLTFCAIDDFALSPPHTHTHVRK
jgi:hypothetical protein